MWKVLALCLRVCVCAQVDMWTVTALGLCCFTCEFRPVCMWMFLYDAQARVRGECVCLV